MWKCKFNKSIINETITNITTQFQLMEIIMLSTNLGNNKITEHKGSGLDRHKTIVYKQTKYKNPQLEICKDPDLVHAFPMEKVG